MGEYAFTFKMNKLADFYNSIKALGVTIATFEHTYNQDIVSDVILDTNGDWKLVFIKRRVGEILEVRIDKGFIFSIPNSIEYDKFCNYFKIGRKKGEFSIRNFVQNLEIQMPSKYVLSDNKRKAILRYNKIDNESNGIYPVGIINWDKVHAENPTLDKNKFHRTQKNLEKVRELYPEIYNKIKDYDISIKFGLEKGEQTENIINLDFE